MYCVNCGSELEDEDVEFCEMCGLSPWPVAKSVSAPVQTHAPRGSQEAPPIVASGKGQTAPQEAQRVLEYTKSQVAQPTSNPQKSLKGAGEKKNTIALVGFLLTLVGGFIPTLGLLAYVGIVCCVIGIAKGKQYPGRSRRALCIWGIIIGLFLPIIMIGFMQ